MKKRMLRLISIVSCLCILLGAIGIDGIFPLMNVSSSGSDENEMTQIEKDFAGYLYDVAKSFGRFYHDCPALGIASDNPELASARLALMSVTKKVLENGMDLILVPFLETM